MSRAMNIRMSENAVLERCKAESVGVSAIEPLPAGGVRLVCMSSDGAALIRKRLKKQLIVGDVTRARYRPERAIG